MTLITVLSLAACTGGIGGPGGTGDNSGHNGGNSGDKPEEELPPEHEHSFEYIEQIPATCETEGYDLYRCSCNEEERVNVIPASGHSFYEKHWYVKTEPTLTEPGLLAKDCTRCDGGDEHELPALNETDYAYHPATNLKCYSSQSDAVDSYCYLYDGKEFWISVEVDIPSHDYQPEYWEDEYSESCSMCGQRSSNCHYHDFVFDNYSASCSICQYESTRTVYKLTATNGTTFIATVSQYLGDSEAIYFDEPKTEIFVLATDYVIAKAPEGEDFIGVKSWNLGNQSLISQDGDTVRFIVGSDDVVFAEMQYRQAQVVVSYGEGIKDADGNFVNPVRTDGGHAYYNLNYGTYTLVPKESSKHSAFVGWCNESDNYESVTESCILTITEGTVDEVLPEHRIMAQTSATTSLLPHSWHEDYVLVKGYLYNDDTKTVVRYDTPTRLPLNAAGNMDINFVNYYNDVNALYVQNVKDGKTLARGLFYETTGSEVYSLNATISNMATLVKVRHEASAENVTVNGIEYCEFKFFNSTSEFRSTVLEVYWGKNAVWMYPGFGPTYFYTAASPEDYLNVSDMSVNISSYSSVITVSLASLPTEEELKAYYVAFMTEYTSSGWNKIYNSRPCGNSDIIPARNFEYYAENIINHDYNLFMYISLYYSCQIDFTLDTEASALIITLSEIRK